MIKKLFLAVAATALVSMASAQVGPAVKETGRAAAEGTEEAGDQARAAVHTNPEKQVYKAKARSHKARARYHRHRAKAATDAAGH